MYYDLLARIKNAYAAEKPSLLVPFSKVDFEISKILVKDKYLHEVQKRAINRKNYMDIKLSYQNHQPSFKDFKIISRPGRRIYTTYHDIKPVKNGYGLAIISTSKGVFNHKEARKMKVGGEYLFEIW